MENSQFEKFCQQVLSGECSALLKTLPPSELLSVSIDEASSDADLYAALHSLQMDPLFLQSPLQSLHSFFHSNEKECPGFSSNALGKLLFIDGLFESMSQNTLLDGVPAAPLFQLKIIVSKLFISGKLFNGNESKIIERLINSLAEMLMGWWLDDSTLNVEKRSAGLHKITDVLIKNYFDDSGLLERQTNVLYEGKAQEERRALKLEKRSIASERGRMRLLHCEEVIADLYNSHFVKITLPEVLYDLLLGLWHEVLLRILLQKEEDNSCELLWKQAAQATGLMMRSVQAGAHLKSFFSRAENLDDDLARIMEQNKESRDDIEQVVSVLHTSQKQMIENKIDGYIQPELIKKGRYFEKTQLLVSAHLKLKIADLKIGNWYFHQCSNSEKKLLKLVQIEEKIGRVLFVGVNGKLLGKSFDEIVFHLASGQMTPAQRGDFFSQHVDITLRHCWDFIENKDKLEKTRKLAALKQQRVQKSAADQQALEAKIREVHSLRQAHEEGSLAVEKLRASAKKVVSLLTLGAWITIQNGEELPQRAKLAVRLVSSGKLIFVDRSGMRIAEYHSKELVELVVTGRVEIIHEGEDFNRTLAGVIGRLS
ncbi:MAG: DUF1631 family protein [Pseudomonadales bacterium]|nr:DUF1631 family protein [Pseudomonadales bacterium]